MFYGHECKSGYRIGGTPKIMSYCLGKVYKNQDVSQGKHVFELSDLSKKISYSLFPWVLAMHSLCHPDSVTAK